MAQAHKILFVCTGNTCRSYMAETIAKGYLSARGTAGNIHISSAGTGCLDGAPAALQARTVMSEMGYSNNFHRARQLTADMVKESNLILTMTQRQRMDILRLLPGNEDKVYLLKEYSLATEENSSLSNLDITDPFGEHVEVYRSCARELEPLVTRVLDGFLNE